MSTAVTESDPKWADTDSAVHELIRARWSPRAFSAQPVSDRDLRLVLEAARWAASSGNEQPWRIFVARKSDAHFEKFLSTLVPFNQAWAKEAPVLLIMAYKKTSSNNGSPNPYGLHDAGQAFANLSLQAVALDLHVHGMAGFDHEKARQLLGIPEDFGLGAAAALGYLGSPDQLDERNRERERAPRTRKPLHEIVFGASWEEAVEL